MQTEMDFEKMKTATLAKIGVATLLSSIMAFAASAEIINSDWKNAGDGLTFTDTNQNLEFLDLTETRNMSFNDVKNKLGTTYPGWVLATEHQVVTMLTNLMSDTEAPYSTTVGQTVTYTLVSSRLTIADMLGADDIGINNYIYGFIGGEDISIYGVHMPESHSRTFYDYWSYSGDYRAQAFSTWLVRDSSASNTTDASAPLALSGIILLGLGLNRRRKVK